MHLGLVASDLYAIRTGSSFDIACATVRTVVLHDLTGAADAAFHDPGEEKLWTTTAFEFGRGIGVSAEHTT